MIVVLTCRRPDGSNKYVRETVRQIDESAKGERRILLSDGPLDDDWRPPSDWEIVYKNRPVIQPQNKWVAWTAFEMAAEANEDLVFFEDDLEFSKNAPGFISKFKVPNDVEFIVFYTPWFTHEIPIGLWRIHAGCYMMAQAMKFSASTAKLLAAARYESIWQEAMALGGLDEILRHIASTNRWRYGIFHPGIVQHIGENSVVGNGPLRGMRSARNYAGKDLDPHDLRQAGLGYFD